MLASSVAPKFQADLFLQLNRSKMKPGVFSSPSSPAAPARVLATLIQAPWSHLQAWQ